MDLLEFLDECQGELSQKEFAAQLGISQAQLSRVCSGKREAGMSVLFGLLRVFPSKRETILALFLTSDKTDRTELKSIGMKVES